MVCVVVSCNSIDITLVIFICQDTIAGIFNIMCYMYYYYTIKW